jgi:hypothetical protein
VEAIRQAGDREGHQHRVVVYSHFMNLDRLIGERRNLQTSREKHKVSTALPREASMTEV